MQSQTELTRSGAGRYALVVPCNNALVYPTALNAYLAIFAER